jgi:hypothetical protein
LIIGFNGGSKVLSNRNFRWGAKVDINLPDRNIKVRYRCTQLLTHLCGDRKTVDFGSWDGYHGQFFECKAQPSGIGCKEISYMQHLKKVLSDHSITHEIFFVCAESRDEVKLKLEGYGLSPLYKPVGVEDIQLMMPA